MSYAVRDCEFREALIEQLKETALTIFENADEIIGDYKYTGDIDITIYLKTDKLNSGIPEISVNKTYYPDYKKLTDITNKLYKKSQESTKKAITEIKKL